MRSRDRVLESVRPHARARHTRRRVVLRCEELEPRCVPTATTLRIATYNIEADINGVTTPRAGLYQVLEGIGEEQVQGHFQPLDILALQETTSNTTTVAPIVSNLNNYYNGLAVYASSPYQATQSGSNNGGNGPNALIYNTLTLNLLASFGVGTPQGSTNGEYRQVVRYEFQPVGASGSSGIFYLYTEHAKAGTTSSDASDRNKEAQIVRNDEATLPAGAYVLYTGDLNTTASTDASYQTLTASTSPLGVAQGAGFDPINRPGSWDLNASSKDIMTESATDLRYRDDHELITQNILNSTPGGIGYVTGSYHTFGVNGTTPVDGSVNSGSDTALNSDLVQDGPTFISASTLYADLTTASDHLPVVADYAIGILFTSTTTLTSSANPSAYGQPVTFTATVSGAHGVPTGTVSFRDNGNQIGTGTLNGSGVATFTTSTLLVGAGHSITAVYLGDTTYATSTSAAINQQLQLGLTSTAVSSSPNPSTAGQSVTFTATVTAAAPSTGTPDSGTVGFRDGSTNLGSSTTNASGVATFTTSTLAVGTHSITAIYLGTNLYGSSTSSPLSQVVNASATTTVLADNGPNPATVGQSVGFTVTVSGGATPTGTVSLEDASNGNAVAGTGTLSGGSASINVSGLTVGTHALFAVYSGDATHSGSQSVQVVQVVNAPATFMVQSIAPLGTPLGFAGFSGSGFAVQFNAPVNLNGLNLYTGDAGATLNARDVEILYAPAGNFTASTVQSFGPAIGEVSQPGPAGDELRFNAVQIAPDTVAFILSGPNHVAAAQILAPGSYRLALSGGSGNNAFLRQSDGAALDGSGDGTVTASDNFVTGTTPGFGDLTVAALPANTVTIGIADVVRGPGETMDVPLMASDGLNLTAVGLTLTLPAGELVVTGFTVNPALGASATFNPATGALTLSAGAPFSATGGPLVLGTFQTQVPGLGNLGTAPLLGTKGIIHLTLTSATDAQFNARPAVDDAGLMVVAYPGDLGAPAGTYTSADVSQLQSLIVGFVSAFALYPNLDPRVIADVNDDGNVNSADVSNLQLRIVGGSSSIPPLPSGASGVGVGGPDPRLYFTNSSAAPGQTITVALNMQVNAAAGLDFQSAYLNFTYDPRLLTLSNVRVGALDGGYLLVANTSVPGQVRVTLVTTHHFLANGTDGSIVLIDFTVNPRARAGSSSPLNLVPALGGTPTAVNGEPSSVSPYPTAGPHDRGVDGTVTILPTRALDAVLADTPQGPRATMATVSNGVGHEPQRDTVWRDRAADVDAATEGLEATPLTASHVARGNTTGTSPFEDLPERLWRP